MDIHYHKHEKRRERASRIWLKMAEEYNKGDKTAEEIAKSYTNPTTGKPYCRETVYWALKQVKKLGLTNS